MITLPLVDVEFSNSLIQVFAIEFSDTPLSETRLAQSSAFMATRGRTCP